MPGPEDHDRPAPPGLFFFAHDAFAQPAYKQPATINGHTLPVNALAIPPNALANELRTGCVTG